MSDRIHNNIVVSYSNESNKRLTPESLSCDSLCRSDEQCIVPSVLSPAFKAFIYFQREKRHKFKKKASDILEGLHYRREAFIPVHSANFLMFAFTSSLFGAATSPCELLNVSRICRMCLKLGDARESSSS
jgi:hypothetical protein